MTGRLRALLALLPGLLAASGEAPVRVYGVEHEVRGERERVLVFADAPVEPHLEASASGAWVVVLPGAVLDPSARERVRPAAAGSVASIAVEERLAAEPEVRVEVVLTSQEEPRLLRRGAIVALDFPRPARVVADGVELRFEAAPVEEVVEAVSRATGERFVFEGPLDRHVSVLLTDRVSPDEALELLHALLRLVELAAVPTPGGALRILPLADLPSHAPFAPGGPRGGGDVPVATLVRLRSADAAETAAALAPWLGDAALALPVAGRDALVLVGAEGHLRTLFRLIEVLDAAAEERLVIRPLRYASAAEVAPRLEEALSGPSGAAAELRAFADPRANRVLVRAPPERLPALRELLDHLDRAPEGRGEVRVRRLRHADPEDLASRLEALRRSGEAASPAVGRLDRDFSVAVDAPTRSLVIAADPETHGQIGRLIDELDRPPPRVQVEVTLLEVMTSEALALGFDAFVPVGDLTGSGSVGAMLLNPSGGGLFQPGAGAAAAPSFGARYTREPVAIPVTGPGGETLTVLVPRESFVLTAEEAIVASRVLSRPHLLVLSGQEHELFVGDEVPVPVSSVDSASSGLLETRVDIQRRDVGVRLHVRPSLGQAGRVHLGLDVETSRVVNRPLPGSDVTVGPTLGQRRVETTVILEDDQVVLVGAGTLRQQQLRDVGTPWLRSVPGLGLLFRATRDERVDVHLLVIAQARIHRDAADDEAEAIRRRLAVERVLARAAPLSPTDGPWAVRVATRRRQDDADAIAEQFRLRGERTRRVSWRWQGGVRHDVLLVGFEDLAATGEASLRVRDAGFTPELVVARGR